MSDQPRKVLIATPAHDGRLDVWYTTSLVNTIRVAQANDIFVHPVFMSYDALVQRARNDLIRLAVEGEYDDLIFIDSDMEWNPMWIMSLLERQEDVVGGTTRKKTDDAEVYVVKASDLTVHDSGLIKAEALGTGFVRLSRKAFLALWDSSPAYQNEGRECRMVCDVAWRLARGSIVGAEPAERDQQEHAHHQHGEHGLSSSCQIELHQLGQRAADMGKTAELEAMDPAEGKGSSGSRFSPAA